MPLRMGHPHQTPERGSHMQEARDELIDGRSTAVHSHRTLDACRDILQTTLCIDNLPESYYHLFARHNLLHPAPEGPLSRFDFPPIHKFLVKLSDSACVYR